jgi:hypothetical protein
MKNIIQKITSLIKETFYSKYFKKKIEKNVADVMSKHTDTLIKLEKYDKREIQKSKKMAKYSSVQDYLRDFQRKTKRLSRDGGPTPAF